MNCGGCTLCCILLDIPWMKSPAGEYCRECVPGSGCKLYNTEDQMPEKCRAFDCAYAQANTAHPDTRPDYVGVMWEKASDMIMWGTYQIINNQEVYMGQISSFMREGFSVAVRDMIESRIHVYHNPLHNEVLLRREMELIKEKYGNVRH